MSLNRRENIAYNEATRDRRPFAVPVISSAGKAPFRLSIDEAACRCCNRCFAAQTCRGNAFRTLDRGDSPFIDMSRCWGCLTCVSACPFGAVIKTDYSSPSLDLLPDPAP
jgi:Fe-S-cluster-containing hydrogenase component 2